VRRLQVAERETMPENLSAKTFGAALVIPVLLFIAWLVSGATNEQLEKAKSKQYHPSQSELTIHEIREDKKGGETQESQIPFGSFSDVVTACATIVMAYLAWRQLKAYRLAVDSERAANDRFVSIENAAHEATQKELRAYISVVGREEDVSLVQDEYTTDYRFSATVDIVNNGNTPAKNIKVYGSADIFGILSHPIDEKVRTDYRIPGIFVDISQGSKDDVFISKKFSKAEIDKWGVMKGLTNLSLSGLNFFGVIEYVDVFGKSWYTQFCYHVRKRPDSFRKSSFHIWRTGPYNEAT
jgi:hypothetical protein